MRNLKLPKNNIDAMINRHMGCLPVLGIIIVTFWTSKMIFLAAEFLYIVNQFGRPAWDHGLRIINKQGDLSNGHSLSGWGYFFIFFGGFLMTIPFFLGSSFGFCYTSMKLRHEKFNEQLELWQSEHNQFEK